ncbi:DNA-binding protein [Streptomyces sp. NPDC093591]|uniref:DNA-binding protein n=1 Tax=Streptomyces sp. NPDC093591 TaxID=3366044 RepID=UPI003819AC5B
MTPTKSQRYGTPVPPADPNQEYMTAQETAYVLRCSLTWLRRFLATHPDLCGRNGKGGKIITDRAQRAAIHAARSAGDPRTGRTIPRQRRPRRTAVKTPAAA